MKNHRGLQGARRLFFAQLGLIALASIASGAMADARTAGSMMLGGLVWMIPQRCFAYLLFSEQRARFSKAILTRAYRGEAFKLFFSAALFAGVFRFGHVVPMVFFIGYMLAQGVSWFAPLFFRVAEVKTSMRVA